MKRRPKTLTAPLVRQLRAVASEGAPNRIAAALYLLDRSRVSLADEIGMSQQQLGDIMHGRWQSVRLETARPIAKALGCRIEDLWPE